MFCQEISSVLLSDKSGNNMLCSILLLSLCFNVLTDYFYWGASSCQQTEALTPKGFFPKFFPNFRILFFQQSATGTFISIDKCFRLTLLYHGTRYRTSVLFYFCAIHLPPAEEGEFLSLGYRRTNFQQHRYFMLYRIENDVVYVDDIFHELQDYENRMI